MKVLFFLTSLGAGGTESSTSALLPALRDRGIECEVAVLKRVDVGFEQPVLEHGFVIHDIGGPTILHRVRALRSLLRSGEPDVLHTAVFDADIVGRLAGWRLPLRVVSSLVNTSYDPIRLEDLSVPAWKLRVVRWLDGWTARHLTHRIHAVSDGVAAANSVHLRIPMAKIEVVERGRDPAALLPSGIDAAAAIRRELGISGNTPILLAIGRIEFQKGHVTLIDALSTLAETAEGHAPVVVIAGREGNASKAVAERIHRHGLEDRVHMLGHRTDIADLLAAADVFVLPSLYEGTAGVVIEAMAGGTPIVSSDVQGLVGVIRHEETALLVPIADSSALTLAIGRVLSGGDEIDRMVHQAAARFRDYFTLDRCADRMSEFYQRVVGAEGDPTGG